MDNFDPNKTPKKQVLSAQIDLSKFEKATEDEKRQQDVMSQSTSFFKDGMRKLFKNRAKKSLYFLRNVLCFLKMLYRRHRSWTFLSSWTCRRTSFPARSARKKPSR